MNFRKVREGFALPSAILVIGILTISIAAGFSLVISERKGVDDQNAQVSAFVLAEQGLQTFFVKRDSLGYTSRPPAAQEGPKRIYLNGGYADVQLNVIRPAIGSLSAVYVVRSKGTQTRGAIGGTPAGIRTVAQYAAWEGAPFSVQAGWTAISGIKKNGNSGSFLGEDACGGEDVAGVAVPVVPGFNRPQTADSVEFLGQTVNDAARAVEVDWAGILAGTAITPHILYPPGPMPNWAADTTYYPTIFVNGDLINNMQPFNGGRGLLIVKGDLGGNGSNMNWKGVILVGNDLTGNGNNTVNGAIISALNAKLGQTVPISTANGTKLYQYNSCEVAKAMRGMGALIPLNNTWVDNWVEY